MSDSVNQSKRPVKGILKNASSFDTDKHENQRSLEKEMKWDEMNILATYHPADKDYGHDKINEPPTPYNRGDSEGCQSGDEMENASVTIDPQLIADGLTMKSKPKLFTKIESESDNEDDDDESNMTQEQKEHKRAFNLRRKLHYNEYQAVKLARQLLKEDEEEEEGEETKSTPSSIPLNKPRSEKEVEMDTESC